MSASGKCTLLLFGALACSTLVGCGVDETGAPPPDDLLYYPAFLQAHPEGRYLYINNAVLDRRFNAGTISVYDTHEHRILDASTLDVPLFGGRLAIFSNGETSSSLYGVISNRDEHSLTTFQVDAERGDSAGHLRLLNTYTDFDDRPMAKDPFDLVHDEDGLLVGHLAAGVVSRWAFEAGSDGQPKLSYNCSLTLPGGAHQIARHPVLGWWYVADRITSSIWIVSERPKEDEDVEGCRLVLEGALGLGTVTSRALTFDATGRRLYVVSSTDGSLHVFDASLDADGKPSNVLLKRIAVGDTPLNVILGPCTSAAATDRSCGRPNAAVERLLYIPLFARNEVVVADPETLDIVARIEVGVGPYDIAFMADELGRMRGYVSHFADSGIGEIDLQPGSENRFKIRAFIR